MGRVKAVFDGGIVAEPEAFTTQSGAHGIRFPVYVADEDKGADGAYTKNGETTKVAVTLWNDVADAAPVLHKGYIVEVDAVIRERAYEGKNGPGRSLETKFVNSVTIKHVPNSTVAPTGGGGFNDEGEVPKGFI